MIPMIHLLMLSHAPIAKVTLLQFSRSYNSGQYLMHRSTDDLHWLVCMQRVNQAVASVSPHLPPDALQSDSSGAALHDSEPLSNVRRLYNERFPAADAPAPAGQCAERAPPPLRSLRFSRRCELGHLSSKHPPGWPVRFVQSPDTLQNDACTGSY